jgi:hypothetical protein
MVEPISLTESWNTRDVTLLGERSAAVFGQFAEHANLADVVFVHRDGADRIVLMPWAFWKRVAATIKVANGEPVPSEVTR